MSYALNLIMVIMVKMTRKVDSIRAGPVLVRQKNAITLKKQEKEEKEANGKEEGESNRRNQAEQVAEDDGKWGSSGRCCRRLGCSSGASGKDG